MHTLKNFAYSNVTKMISCIFFYKSFIVSPFVFKSSFLLELLLAWDLRWESQYVFFQMDILVESALFVRKIILFSLHSCRLCCKSSNQICVGCSWALIYSVLLVFLPVRKYHTVPLIALWQVLLTVTSVFQLCSYWRDLC